MSGLVTGQQSGSAVSQLLSPHLYQQVQHVGGKYGGVAAQHAGAYVLVRQVFERPAQQDGQVLRGFAVQHFEVFHFL